MNYFIDTNIPIGYTVIHDKWHDISKNFINNHQHGTIFWSNLVKKEYAKKLNNIIDHTNTFLNQCKTLLKNNQKDFVNYYYFENFLIENTKVCQLDKNKKQKILEHFWNKYDIIDGISDVVYLKFVEFIHEFERLYHIRDNKIKKILILHDCHLNNFLRYLDYAMKLCEWGIHKPDCKIVVDAHDCGLTHQDLIFVSTDNKMINNILKHDYSFLSITEFKSCT